MRIVRSNQIFSLIHGLYKVMMNSCIIVVQSAITNVNNMKSLAVMLYFCIHWYVNYFYVNMAYIHFHLISFEF